MKLTFFIFLISLTSRGLLAFAKPLPPSQDDWYRQPSNISDYVAGQVIRSRQIQNQLQPFIDLPVHVSVKAVHQYLYRTIDSSGNAVASVTTLIIPFNSDPTKLLAYETAYDSANPDCSPSYTLQKGSASPSISGMLLPNSSLTIDTPFIAAALNQGWWVTTSDYEGLEAHFADGLGSGLATLDSVRMILSEAPRLGLSRDANYALWGFSGGSLACGWAAELQPSYAPELAFQGAAIGDTIANVSNVFASINGSSSSGLAFGAVHGLAKSYSNFSDWLDSNLVPETRNEFFTIGTSCLIGEETLGAHQDLYSYFITADQAVYDPIPVSVLRLSGEMGWKDTPEMPLYMYKSVKDHVSPIEDTDSLVGIYCARGATINYHRHMWGGHATESIVGSVNAFGWIADRLEGKPISEPGLCEKKNIRFIELDERTVQLIGKEIMGLLASVIGGSLKY